MAKQGREAREQDLVGNPLHEQVCPADESRLRDVAAHRGSKRLVVIAGDVADHTCSLFV